MFTTRFTVRPCLCTGLARRLTSSRPARGAALLLLLGITIPPAAAGASSGTQATESQSQIGLSVQPPVMRLPDVRPGQIVSLPAPITIRNSGTRSITVQIRPIRISSLGKRSTTGYVDIPDPSWCVLEESTLTLAPGKSRPVAVSLLVPDAPCHYNRHWCVAFSVKTGGSQLGAAVYPYVYVETVSSTNFVRPPEATGDARALSPESPGGTDTSANAPVPTAGGTRDGLGCVVVYPAVLDGGDVPIGCEVRAGSISIRNELDKDVLLSVDPIVPEPSKLARLVLLTPGYMWMRNPRWLSPATRTVLVPAGEEARFDVTVSSPSDPTTANFRWEGFVFIRDSDGLQSLVRVHWRTTSDSGETSECPGENTHSSAAGAGCSDEVELLSHQGSQRKDR